MSNLHACPEGCVILAEHHYQFNRLQFHGMNDESYQVLDSDTGFDAMKLAQDVLPDQQTQLEWKSIAIDEILKMNKLKYEHCLHARDTLARMTTNTFWGTGLIPDHTRYTLSNYWPGQNHMGKILVQICWEIADTESITEK